MQTNNIEVFSKLIYNDTLVKNPIMEKIECYPNQNSAVPTVLPYNTRGPIFKFDIASSARIVHLRSFNFHVNYTVPAVLNRRIYMRKPIITRIKVTTELNQLIHETDHLEHLHCAIPTLLNKDPEDFPIYSGLGFKNRNLTKTELQSSLGPVAAVDGANAPNAQLINTNSLQAQLQTNFSLTIDDFDTVSDIGGTLNVIRIVNLGDVLGGCGILGLDYLVPFAKGFQITVELCPVQNQFFLDAADNQTPYPAIDSTVVGAGAIVPYYNTGQAGETNYVPSAVIVPAVPNVSGAIPVTGNVGISNIHLTFDIVKSEQYNMSINEELQKGDVVTLVYTNIQYQEHPSTEQNPNITQKLQRDIGDKWKGMLYVPGTEINNLYPAMLRSNSDTYWNTDTTLQIGGVAVPVADVRRLVTLQTVDMALDGIPCFHTNIPNKEHVAFQNYTYKKDALVYNPIFHRGQALLNNNFHLFLKWYDTEEQERLGSQNSGIPIGTIDRNILIKPRLSAPCVGLIHRLWFLGTKYITISKDGIFADF